MTVVGADEDRDERVVEYLTARGWTEENARDLVLNGRGTLVYAAAAWNSAWVQLGRVILSTLPGARR